MNIWVDADACPVVIKEILYKAAERTQTNVILVANKQLHIPRSRYIAFQKVSSGPDAADNEIAQNMEPGDLVITSDIPLAAKVVANGGLCINPRGETYTAENIKERLSTRDFMDMLRSSGIETGGPPSLSNRDKQLFANALDRTVRKIEK